MANAFKIQTMKNKNINIEFFDNGKRRTIVFHKDHPARQHCVDLFNAWFKKDQASMKLISIGSISNKFDDKFKEIINELRKTWHFTKNANNPQYFYAERKLSNAAKTAA